MGITLYGDNEMGHALLKQDAIRSDLPSMRFNFNASDLPTLRNLMDQADGGDWLSRALLFKVLCSQSFDRIVAWAVSTKKPRDQLAKLKKSKLLDLVSLQFGSGIPPMFRFPLFNTDLQKLVQFAASVSSDSPTAIELNDLKKRFCDGEMDRFQVTSTESCELRDEYQQICFRRQSTYANDATMHVAHKVGCAIGQHVNDGLDPHDRVSLADLRWRINHFSNFEMASAIDNLGLHQLTDKFVRSGNIEACTRARVKAIYLRLKQIKTSINDNLKLYERVRNGKKFAESLQNLLTNRLQQLSSYQLD